MIKKINLDKGVKTVLIILVIYVGIVLLIFLPNYLKKQKENLYIMTNRYRIKYEKGAWQNIIDGDEYKTKTFDIYEDNNYFGKYKILFSNSSFSLRDDEDRIVDYSGYIFATSGSIKNKLYNYELDKEYTFTDQEVIKEALKSVEIDEQAYYNIHQKVRLNLDNKKATIYYVDNIKEADEDSLDGITGPVANSSGKNYALLVLYKNNKVYIIDKIITEKNDFRVFEILNIMDIREDGKLELIYVLGNRYSNDSDCVKLYNLENNKEIHNFCE